MAATDYSERIPAAIAKGKEWLGDRTWRITWVSALSDYVCLTAGEVALAEALWMLHVRDFAMTASKTHDCSANEYGPCQALAAFCEKMEGLNDD